MLSEVVPLLRLSWTPALLLQTRKEVAVKVVRKDMFRQDPKAEQNLRREIRIQKELASEYVVRLYHVQVSSCTRKTHRTKEITTGLVSALTLHLSC